MPLFQTWKEIKANSLHHSVHDFTHTIPRADEAVVQHSQYKGVEEQVSAPSGEALLVFSIFMPPV